jgi:hypothetical protein
MENAKLTFTCIFLLVVWVGVACVEFSLMMHFGTMFSLFASVSGLSVLLGTLLQAPEGYEDQSGFHILVAAA